jgi:diguanylate cyclase (GGDEF)-like protein
MSFAAASIYWVIVAIWSVVLGSVAYFYIRNPRAFGTVRLLLIVIGIDTLRNLFENVYFGLYFGGRYGLFPEWIVGIVGQPGLLIIPKLLNVVAGCLVLGLLLGRWLPMAVKEWKHSEQRAADLQTLAAIDPLTGVSNRRQFDILGQAELARCQRYLRPLSLLLLDIDHFKDVNDSLGHDAGDWVLKHLAEILTWSKRDADLVARIGGEEFAILLPETGQQAARTVAERLSELVRSFSFSVNGEKLRVTVSIGVAEATQSTPGIEALLRNADHALYQAKRAGRDRVVVHVAPMMESVQVAAE